MAESELYIVRSICISLLYTLVFTCQLSFSQVPFWNRSYISLPFLKRKRSRIFCRQISVELRGLLQDYNFIETARSSRRMSEICLFFCSRTKVCPRESSFSNIESHKYKFRHRFDFPPVTARSCQTNNARVYVIRSANISLILCHAKEIYNMHEEIFSSYPLLLVCRLTCNINIDVGPTCILLLLAFRNVSLYFYEPCWSNTRLVGIKMYFS